MISSAAMTKKVPGIATLAGDASGLFKRHETGSRFRGFVDFDGRACALLEVADTPGKRAQGMMKRQSLLDGCGMIFTDLEPYGAFWMKNCLIPLDVIFLDRSKKASRIYSMPADGGRARYPYTTEKTAIELPYGFCDKYGITEGVTCKWRTW